MDPHQEIQRAKVNQNSWKLALTKHIVNLEDNLAQLSIIAGIKYVRIVVNDSSEEAALLEEPKGLGKHEVNTYEKIINEHSDDINRSVTAICNLISCDAEFDLPIPVVVLLKLAAKVGQLRWSDFGRKIPGTLAKKFIYNKTSINMIQTSLTMFRWISSTLATDILPFQQFINEYYLNLLEWTRSSHLEKHDLQQYYWIRSLVFTGITWELAQFSLNINYNSEQLKTLIGTELIDEVSRVPQQDEFAVQKYVHDALNCLEWLFISYSKWLDAQLEFKLKNFILHTCLEIYRNFEKNTIGLDCRRQLLRVLVTMANQPFASSTTELAWHILEQASRLEHDLEIVMLSRKAIDLGLANRPSVIPSKDYYALSLNSASQISQPAVTTNGYKAHSGSDVEYEPEEEESNVPEEKSSEREVIELEKTRTEVAGNNEADRSESNPKVVPELVTEAEAQAERPPEPVSKPEHESGGNLETTTELKTCPPTGLKSPWKLNKDDVSFEAAATVEPEPSSAIRPEVDDIAVLFVDEPAK